MNGALFVFGATLAALGAICAVRCQGLRVIPWLVAMALLGAAAACSAATCSWDGTPRDRYTGTPEAALEHYRDIPRETRARLLKRMDRFQYDDRVEIDSQSIRGERGEYAPDLFQMHYGTGRVCDTVTRPAGMRPASALVYTEDGYSVADPSACGNWVRLRRTRPPMVTPDRELEFDAPSAGFINGGGIPISSGTGFPIVESDAPLPPAFEHPAYLVADGLAPIPAYWPGDYGPQFLGPVFIERLPVIAAPVPEPSPSLLFLVGLVGVGAAAWRGRRSRPL